MISDVIPNVSHMQVYNFRRSNGISSKDVLAKRYATWVRMIEQGDSLEVIAALYHVQPRSIKMALWKNMKISFKKVKREAQEAKKKQLEREIKKKTKKPFDW